MCYLQSPLLADIPNKLGWFIYFQYLGLNHKWSVAWYIIESGKGVPYDYVCSSGMGDIFHILYYNNLLSQPQNISKSQFCFYWEWTIVEDHKRPTHHHLSAISTTVKDQSFSNKILGIGFQRWIQ